MRTGTAVISTDFRKPFVLLIAAFELAEGVYNVLPMRLKINGFQITGILN